MTGSDTQTLPRSSVSISLSPFLCAAIYFLPMTRSNPSRANVWQLAWGESSYFGIHITGPLAYVLNSHKTNTFFAVDENKIRARDESEKDLRATLIYMCRNTVCWKKKRDEKHMKPNQGDHTYSIHHSHTCVLYMHMLTALFPMPSERLSSSDHHAWAHSTSKGRCRAEGRRKEGWRGGEEESWGGRKKPSLEGK